MSTVYIEKKETRAVSQVDISGVSLATTARVCRVVTSNVILKSTSDKQNIGILYIANLPSNPKMSPKKVAIIGESRL